jgi:hypothetical protein
LSGQQWVEGRNIIADIFVRADDGFWLPNFASLDRDQIVIYLYITLDFLQCQTNNDTLGALLKRHLIGYKITQ